MRIRVVPFMNVPAGAFFGEMAGPGQIGLLHRKLPAGEYWGNAIDKDGMLVQFAMMAKVGYITEGTIADQLAPMGTGLATAQ